MNMDRAAACKVLFTTSESLVSMNGGEPRNIVWFCLNIECIDVFLKDISEPFEGTTSKQPKH